MGNDDKTGWIQAITTTIDTNHPDYLRGKIAKYQTETGEWVSLPDHQADMKVLKEALETMITMLKATDMCLRTWNQTGSPVNVEYGIQQAHAALEATK